MDPFVRKMILGGTAFLIGMLLMLAVLTVFYLHTHPRCSEQVLSETASPDGRFVAAVLRRRCGEYAPFFVHVNLRPAGSSIHLRFFSGRATDGQVFLAEQDAPETVPQIVWTSPASLKIACAGCRSSQSMAFWGSISLKVADR